MKSKKSKKILGLAVAAALVVSAAAASMSTFASPYADITDVPGYSNNGTDADDTDDYVQRKLTFDVGGFADVSSAQLACDPAMLAEDYAVDIKIPEDYVPVYADCYPLSAVTDYDFVGWSDIDGNTYKPGDTVAAKAASVSLSAVWEYAGNISLCLKYDDGFSGDGEVEYSTVKVEDKTASTFKVKAPDALSNKENKFLGWTTTDKTGATVTVDAGAEVEIALDGTPDQNVVFKAKWEKTTFGFSESVFVEVEAESDKYDNDASPNIDGGYSKYLYHYEDVVSLVKDTATGDVTYKEGSELKAPPASEVPKREGYVFDGWLLTATSVKYQPGEVIPYRGGDYLLRAVYKEDATKNTNTVRTAYFDGDKWTVAKTDEVAKDATSYEVEVPAALTNSENTFLKWKDADGNEYAPGDKFTVTDPTKFANGSVFEFYAVWEKETLAVERDAILSLLLPLDESVGGYPIFKEVKTKIPVVVNLKTKEITLKTEQSITVPKDVPEVEGMTFKGWNEKADGTGKAYKAGDKIPVAVSQDGQYIERVELFAMFEKSSGKGEGGSVANPGTGDDFNAVPFAIAAVVALGAMAGVAVYKKKRESTEDAQ